MNTATSGAITSTYNAGTGVWTASGALADVNALLAGLTFTPSANDTSTFTIATSVSDGVAAPITGVKSMTGTAVNDAPTATNLSAAETYTEDTPLSLIDIVISDVDSANVTATLTLSNVAAGSLNTATSGAVTSTYNAGTGVWTASGALADVNALLAGLTFTPTANFNSAFTIATSVSDGVAAPVTGIKAMTGTAANDSPTATNLNAAETYTEDTPLNLVDIVISDVDSATGTATLTLSDVAAGSLNTGTSGAVTSTFVGGVWTASGALADVNALLAGLTFTPGANYNSAFTIATSVSDGVAAPITGTKAMTGTPDNDAPTATNLSAAETYTEATPLNLVDIVISDIDSANVTATLTLSNVAAGSLNTATSGAVTSTWNAGTGVWTASGAVADVNALLAGLTFTPTANYNSAFTIATSVSDWVAAPVTGTKAMTGTPVNDAPTATNLSAAEAYTEDTPLNLADIVVTDVDSANVTATLTLSDVAAGSLNTGTSGAVTSTFVGGVWTASGAIADVNALLAGLTFTPAANFNANFSIATSVNDGVAAPITGTKAMTGTPVNDAPAITSGSGGSSAAMSIAENSSAISVVTGADVDRDVVRFSIAGGADAARFQLDPATGALAFVAAPDFESPADSDRDNVYEVLVGANDGRGGSALQSLRVAVSGINEDPTAVPDVLDLSGDVPTIIVQTTLLTNDLDVDGDTLQVVAVTPPTYGAIATDASGGLALHAGARILRNRYVHLHRGRCGWAHGHCAGSSERHRQPAHSEHRRIGVPRRDQRVGQLAAVGWAGGDRDRRARLDPVRRRRLRPTRPSDPLDDAAGDAAGGATPLAEGQPAGMPRPSTGDHNPVADFVRGAELERVYDARPWASASESETKFDIDWLVAERAAERPHTASIAGVWRYGGRPASLLRGLLRNVLRAGIGRWRRPARGGADHGRFERRPECRHRGVAVARRRAGGFAADRAADLVVVRPDPGTRSTPGAARRPGGR